MGLDRRDFMKYFGIGTTIVPLIAGMPKPEVAAKLIEEPKVDLVVAQAIPDPHDLLRARKAIPMIITFVNDDGLRHTFDCHSFVTDVRIEMDDVTTLSGNGRWREWLPTLIDGNTVWTLKGIIAGMPQLSARAR